MGHINSYWFFSEISVSFAWTKLHPCCTLVSQLVDTAFLSVRSPVSLWNVRLCPCRATVLSRVTVMLLETLRSWVLALQGGSVAGTQDESLNCINLRCSNHWENVSANTEVKIGLESNTRWATNMAHFFISVCCYCLSLIQHKRRKKCWENFKLEHFIQTCLFAKKKMCVFKWNILS